MEHIWSSSQHHCFVSCWDILHIVNFIWTSTVTTALELSRNLNDYVTVDNNSVMCLGGGHFHEKLMHGMAKVFRNQQNVILFVYLWEMTKHKTTFLITANLNCLLHLWCYIVYHQFITCDIHTWSGLLSSRYLRLGSILCIMYKIVFGKESYIQNVTFDYLISWIFPLVFWDNPQQWIE